MNIPLNGLQKSLFPASCAGSECTKDECCEEIPGRENKHKSGCGCMKCGMERESGGSKAQGGKVDMSAIKSEEYKFSGSCCSAELTKTKSTTQQ